MPEISLESRPRSAGNPRSAGLSTRPKLGKSTVDKLLIGQFSDCTLAIVEGRRRSRQRPDAGWPSTRKSPGTTVSSTYSSRPPHRNSRQHRASRTARPPRSCCSPVTIPGGSAQKVPSRSSAAPVPFRLRAAERTAIG
jgi:hypothetical protein